MTGAETVVLLDLDNTLIDHDELKRSVGAWVEEKTAARPAEFWAIYEEVREEFDIVDFLEAARRFGEHIGRPAAGESLRRFLWDYPFERILLPGTLDGLRRLSGLGPVAVLCDGEPAFQRRKLWRLEFLEHLDHVFVFKHKEHHFSDVEARYPGYGVILFDDKPPILVAAKRHFGERLTAVHIQHGHYAIDDAPAADHSLRSLGEFSSVTVGL